MRLHRLVWVYSCQNATILEISCCCSNVIIHWFGWWCWGLCLCSLHTIVRFFSCRGLYLSLSCLCTLVVYIVTTFLAHRIRISDILPWDRKSYLTQAILPMLSREGYIHRLYWNSRTWLSSDVIVMLKWSHHVKLHLSVFRNFWKLILKYKNSGEQEKESIIRVRVG